MPKIVGDVAIEVGANIAPLVRDLGKGKGHLNQFGRDAESVGARMQRFATSAAVAFGAVAAGAAALGGAPEVLAAAVVRRAARPKKMLTGSSRRS